MRLVRCIRARRDAPSVLRVPPLGRWIEESHGVSSCARWGYLCFSSGPRGRHSPTRTRSPRRTRRAPAPKCLGPLVNAARDKARTPRPRPLAALARATLARAQLPRPRPPLSPRAASCEQATFFVRGGKDTRVIVGVRKAGEVAIKVSHGVARPAALQELLPEIELFGPFVVPQPVMGETQPKPVDTGLG